MYDNMEVLKKGKWIVLSIFLVGFVVGAVALASFVLMSPGTAVLAQTGGETGQPEAVIAVEQVINGESFSGEVRVIYEDSPDLPSEPAATGGLFLARNGDTFSVNSGPIEVEVSVDVVNDEEPVRSVSARPIGEDEASFVITDKTIIYEDVTEEPNITPEDIEAGELIITRTVVPGSADEIGENMVLRAWGSEQNGQIVADVLVYEPIR
jgi:hypothetical protein